MLLSNQLTEYRFLKTRSRVNWIRRLIDGYLRPAGQRLARFPISIPVQPVRIAGLMPLEKALRFRLCVEI